MKTETMDFQHWDDVVFEYRNKEYGAYLLRQAYPWRLSCGMMAAVASLMIVLVGPRLVPRPVAVRSLIVADRFEFNPLPPPAIRPRPKPLERPPSGDRQRRPVMVTRDAVVEASDSTELSAHAPGEQGGTGQITGPGETGLTGLTYSNTVVPVVPPVLDHAALMPVYEGGTEAMMKFIRRKIRYPHAPQRQQIEGTVYVRFVVNGDGSVTNVEVIRGVHPDYDREAARVVAMLPSWKGGKHNGMPVSVRMVLPVKFSLQEP